MFELLPTRIHGCMAIVPIVRGDARGRFTKTFHRESFERLGLPTEFAEDYVSVSHRGVIRGMHFQAPPCAHDKLVFCLQGEAFDVIIDLRRGSSSFGQVVTLDLNDLSGGGVIIPVGCAHGFCALSDACIMAYKVTTAYDPSADMGLRWDSFGVVWPVEFPIVSPRDEGFPTLAEFDSPFV